MDSHEGVAVGTRAWVEQRVGGGCRVDGVERLRGGWTSEVRRLRISGPGTPQWLVLRSFVKPLGPADLDVAHCSTAHALLYGAQEGMRFAERYLASGGTLSEDPAAHLYWRVLDALAFAPDAEKVAGPWRDLGRDDLTPALLTSRLEDYLHELLCRFDC